MICLRNVEKSYASAAGPVRVLSNVNLDIAAGEVCALVGPSGSGKSTLMNILGLLDRADAGTYCLAGNTVDGQRPDALARLRNRTIGFVFQAFHLIDRLTALENVALPLKYRGVGRAERDHLAREALTCLGLSDRQHHRPGELSGGQCQRVALARAIVGRPSLLLADEPTGSLDSASAASVMMLLAELNATLKLTIVVVTHDLAVADHCGRRLEIRDGRLLGAA